MNGRSGEGQGSYVSPGECHVLAKTDPDCGNSYFMGSDRYCYCWRKDACCGSCLVGAINQAFDLYEVDLGEPNPTCQDGLLSKDGTLCCSIVCQDMRKMVFYNRCGDESLDNDDEGKPNCGSASGLNALCCKDDLNNICTEHGFPCLIWLRLIYAYKI